MSGGGFKTVMNTFGKYSAIISASCRLLVTQVKVSDILSVWLDCGHAGNAMLLSMHSWHLHKKFTFMS